MTERKNPRRVITVIDLFGSGPPAVKELDFAGCTFEITSYPVNWNLQVARSLAAQFDGYSDAIVFQGLIEQASLFREKFIHRPTQELLGLVGDSKVYTGQKLRDVFASWTVNRMSKESPALIPAKRVLFHAAVVSSILEPMAQAGAAISCADFISLLGIPLPVTSLSSLQKAVRAFKPMLSRFPLEMLAPAARKGGRRRDANQRFLKKLIDEADIFVTFRGLITAVGDFSALKDKIVIIDGASPEQLADLRAAGVAEVIECTPRIPALEDYGVSNFGVIDAIIDQLRLLQAPDTPAEQFTLEFIEAQNVSTGKRVLSAAPMPLRCAFVVHPLHQSDLYRSRHFRWLKKAPPALRDQVEEKLSYVPPLVHGQITGIRSALTGQEVICDVYSVASTPRVMRRMNEQRLYGQLVQAAELAKKRGACLMGLGAYTKVIGDAGITVAKLSPLPVTNGNSYSTAATLWAAREMALKMGFVKAGMKRISGKAMVIGATGCIGRVSSHLLAFVFDELVLVGRRVDKLLELRDEIRQMNSKVKLEISTQPNTHLPDTDVIVTATSNESGQVLDIMSVRPGAVICDCSRPLDIGPEEAAKRPDVMIIESGEIDLPGELKFTCDIGLPYPSVYACLAETVLLAMDGRLESFSLGKQLSLRQVKDIYKIGIKHGARLSAIRGPLGNITEADIDACRRAAADARASQSQPPQKAPKGKGTA